MPTAGRKRVYNDPMDVHTVRFTAAQARKGRRYGKHGDGSGSLGAGLRLLLDRAPWPDEHGNVADAPKRRASDR